MGSAAAVEFQVASAMHLRLARSDCAVQVMEGNVIGRPTFCGGHGIPFSRGWEST